MGELFMNSKCAILILASVIYINKIESGCIRKALARIFGQSANSETDDKKQAHQHQILGDFLKERRKESTRNLLNSSISDILESTTKELQVEEKSDLQQDKALQEDILDTTTKSTFHKEDSDSELDLMPQKGDKVKVKYPDGWYDGRVESAKRNYFWVKFKGFDQIYKVRKEEKFKII